ncbi:hypothetical protein G5I_12837 [Acromyrmex echinatior]|uniref:Uncharacterized protein n=1 Tax=Acromyrmex echinatior TaxID=103372 RepID=F4X3F4_ACREC|nr:hypothetical protein G5I_12837 [Acromyrmex echinatior]
MNTWEARRFHLDDRERMSVTLVGKVRKYSLMPHLDRCPEYHGTYKELGSQPLPTIVTEDTDNSGHVSQGHRPRADTWGSHSKTIRKSSYGSAPSSGKSTPLPQPAEPSSSSSSGKSGRKTSGTRSGSTSRSNSRSNSAERRRSGGGTDDTASPTRKPALFDAFRPRSKSDASKRKPSIIANMKSAVQHSLHRSSHGSSSVDVHTEKEHHRESQKEQKENRDQGSGRPRAGSESRHRSHSALSAEDKRKARFVEAFSCGYVTRYRYRAFAESLKQNSEGRCVGEERDSEERAYES